MHNLAESLGCNKARCMLLSIMLLITTSILILSVASHLVFSGSINSKRIETGASEAVRAFSSHAENSENLRTKIVGSSLLRAGRESIPQVCI